MSVNPRLARANDPSADARDDATVIARSWDEPEEFTAIFDRYAEQIRRYVVGRLGHAADAEDVVGDTFLVAFRQRSRYDLSRVDARPWLYGIASNQLKHHRRHEVRAYRALTRAGVRPVPDSPSDRVDARVTAQLAKHQLAAGLAGLPRRDRDVVLLIAWADLSYDQVAEALSIPVGTVRSRLNRARRKLREALGGSDPRSVDEGGFDG